MCPFCFANLVGIAAGTTSAGSLGALALNLSRRGGRAGEIVSHSRFRSKSNSNSNSNDRSSPDVYERNSKAEGSIRG